MSLHFRWVGVLAVLLPATGCAGNGGGEDGPTCNSQGPDGSIEGGLTCGNPFVINEPDGTRGLFGVKITAFVHVNAAGIVETDTVSSFLALANIGHDTATNEAQITVQLCEINIPKVEIPGQPEPTSFELLPTMLPNVAPVDAPGFFTGSETCDEFGGDTVTTIIGAQLADPLVDPLPGIGGPACNGPADTGCLVDVDQDGKPGATLIASNIPGVDVTEAYAALRAEISMTGFVADSDQLLGTAQFALEKVILGCRLLPVGGGPERDCNADELGIVTQIDPELSQTEGVDSTFLAIRVPAGSTCDDVIATAETLFGR